VISFSQDDATIADADVKYSNDMGLLNDRLFEFLEKQKARQ